MIPSQRMEFLGKIINSKELTISSKKLTLKCLDLQNSSQVSMLQLTKVLENLISTIQAFLSARLTRRVLKQQQIQALRKKKPYSANITLNKNSKQKYLLWIKKLDIFNGTSLLKQVPKVVLQTDALLSDWGAALHGKPLVFIYLFNSLFTVDFSVVTVTNLHRLTENFIIKRKN